MNKIESKKLYLDTIKLYEEYQKEDKRKYEDMYKKCFQEANGYTVISKPLSLKLTDSRTGTFYIEIKIEIIKYPTVVTYFCSDFDMERYAEVLRQNTDIRDFTKLCIYIEKNIKPYNTIDDDLKTLNNKKWN